MKKILILLIVVIGLVGCDANVEVSNDENGTNININTNENSDTKTESYQPPQKFGTDNCLNCDGSSYEDYVDSTNGEVIPFWFELSDVNNIPAIDIKKDSDTSYTLTVDWDNAKQVYFNVITDKSGTENIDITLDQKVKEISFGSVSQDSTGGNIIFLMKDGTVEFIPVQYDLQQGKFESYGKIDGVTDVVSVYSAFTRASATILAFKADGTFYNLGGILAPLGLYKNY